MKTIRFNSKRIFSLLSCFALLLSLSISVNASEVVDSYNGTMYYDMISGCPITWGYSRDNTPNTYSGIVSVSQARMYFKWTPPVVSLSGTELYIQVYSSATIPNAPLLYTSSTSSSLVGSLVGSFNNIYEYKFSLPDVYTDLTFAFRYNDSSTKQIGIVSAFAFSYLYENITYANFYAYSTTIQMVDLHPRLVRTLHLSEANEPIPFGVGQILNDYSNEEIYIDISSDSRKLDHYSKVSLLCDVLGIPFTDGFSAALYAPGSSTPNYVLPVKYTKVNSYEVFPSGLLLNTYTYDTYLLEIDLTGYDLSNYTIDICINMEPVITGVYPESGDSTESTFFFLRSLWFDPVVTQQAWYVRMWSWISGGFDRVVNKLEDLLGNNSQKAEDLQDGADQIEDAAGAAASDQEFLNSVTRPEVDVNVVDSYANFDSSAISVLSVFTGNQYIGSLILLAVTFAMIGYIFYGKK